MSMINSLLYLMLTVHRQSELPSQSLIHPFSKSSFACLTSYPASWSCQDFTLEGVAQGSFLSLARPGTRYLVAAPHGGYDAGTESIVFNLFSEEDPESRFFWSQIIAQDFRGGNPSGQAHNVNRPSTLNQDTCADIPELQNSQKVYEAFRDHLKRLAPRPTVYVEIHGQSKVGLENRLEIATARISAAEASTIRQILAEELARAQITDIEIAIEPIDKIYYNAGLTKVCGSIQFVSPSPAIHLEVPLSMREGDEALLRSTLVFRAFLHRLAIEIFN